MRRTRLRTAGLCVLLTGLGLRGGDSERALSDSTEWRLYDRNPDHVWNRLYRSFYGRAAADGREYGYDELDPLLWDSTKRHLSGESHDRAIRVLDEFLRIHAERLIPDPLKRAILQRDLWAVFDWAAGAPEPKSLQVKLAQVIRRLALSDNEIRSLPDNYRYAGTARGFR